MRNTNHHVKTAVCSILAVVFLWPLAAHAAALPPDLHSATPLHFQAFLVCAEPNELHSLLEAALRRVKPDIVLEPNEVSSLVEASLQRAKPDIGPLWLPPERAAGLPPEPDNAALLYYQAFLARPDPNEATFRRIEEVLRGAKPDKGIREYLQRCCLTVQLAHAASQIRHCDWGIVYSHGPGLDSNLIWQMRQLSFVLDVYARTLAIDEKYRAALETCLALRRLSTRIGEDTYLMYLGSLTFDRRSLGCIRHVLGSMPPDIDTLTWLQGQLAVQGAPRSPVVWMEMARDIDLQFMRTKPERLARWRKQVEKSVQGQRTKKDILSLTDEEVLLRARQSCDGLLNSLNRVIGSDIPYVEKRAEMQRLLDELEQQPVSNPVVLVWFGAGHLIPCHEIYVRQVAYFNTVRAAIEIYLATAKTGRLPEMLPDHLPKDPYSGQGFEYETTEDGFVLRCRVKAIHDNKVWQYEFKVRKSD
jgi:hypothetical protein